MITRLIYQSFLPILGLFLTACVLSDDGSTKKLDSTGLIATPPSYYSTAKARYLAVRYKDNLDRLVERVTRNPKTTMLQFANNISSVGGIGFFTHSATQTADERYLELVLAAPETFEVKGEFSDKVQQLFSRYGKDLLEIVNADNDIYQDREMSGYGINLSWRNVLSTPSGKRVALERAILYFSKERVRSFVRQNVDQNDLLGSAVIFAVEEDGPLNLVSYRPQGRSPDIRPAIQEDNLASAGGKTQPQGAAGSAITAKPLQLDQTGESETTERDGQAKIEAKAAHQEGAAAPSEGLEAVDMTSSEAVPPEEFLAKPAGVGQPRSGVAADKPVPEQLAALKSEASEAISARRPSQSGSSRPLEGFIVQIAFSDKEKAQSWAETMEKRGFAVSVTQAGSQDNLRVRLGNFAGRDDAERQLRSLKQEGLKGIVIRLPQAFQPTARTSIP